MAVKDESIAVYEEAEARTIDCRASGERDEGGSDGAAEWKKSGCDLSRHY